MVARMLDFIRMIPIYRFRDGLAAMKNNQETFNKGFEVLGNGGSIVMFPEGNHSLERRVRPLTKGLCKASLWCAREAYSAASLRHRPSRGTSYTSRISTVEAKCPYFLVKALRFRKL